MLSVGILINDLFEGQIQTDIDMCRLVVRAEDLILGQRH